MSSSMILTIEVRVSWVVIRESRGSSSSSPSLGCNPLVLGLLSGQAEDFPRCRCFVDSRIVVSKSFLYCLVVLHFVRPLFCDDHHQIICIVQVHEKVHQLCLASFVSSAKPLVLESDP
jgi:hypothetical protein